MAPDGRSGGGGGHRHQHRPGVGRWRRMGRPPSGGGGGCCAAFGGRAHMSSGPSHRCHGDSPQWTPPLPTPPPLHSPSHRPSPQHMAPPPPTPTPTPTRSSGTGGQRFGRSRDRALWPILRPRAVGHEALGTAGHPPSRRRPAASRGGRPRLPPLPERRGPRGRMTPPLEVPPRRVTRAACRRSRRRSGRTSRSTGDARETRRRRRWSLRKSDAQRGGPATPLALSSGTPNARNQSTGTALLAAGLRGHFSVGPKNQSACRVYLCTRACLSAERSS